MRLANNRDGPHADIIGTLRQLGCSVADTSRVGDDFPDLAVGLFGCTHLVEIKAPGKRLTDGQVEFAAQWRGERPVTLWSCQQAEAWVLAVRRRVLGTAA